MTETQSEPTMRIVAVYAPDGNIRQVVMSQPDQAKRQHLAFDGHASIDVTDFAAKHALSLETLLHGYVITNGRPVLKPKHAT